MGLFDKIKSVFTKEDKSTKTYEKGLSKTRKSFVNKLANLSKEYDEIRIKIASFLSIDADALPFLGELVTINEDSGEWRIPILKLLNAHALDLLVDKEHETKIAEFLDYNDVGLDIKVIVVDERLFMEDKDNALSHFIEIREKKNPYKKWLKNYAVKHISITFASVFMVNDF